MAAIDVPADQVAGCLPVSFAGEAALVPKALLRLAVDHHIPVTVYLTGLDMTTGQRHLAVHSLGAYTDAQALADAVFGFLDEAIHSQSTAWHFWSEAPRFFRGHE